MTGALLRGWVAVLALLLAGSASADLCGDLDQSLALDQSDIDRARALLAGLLPPPTFREELLCNLAPDLGSSLPGGVLQSDCSILDVALAIRILDGATAAPAPVCPGGSPDDCCSEHAGVGCNDLAVVECVCSGDPHCCEQGWDATCAQRVGELECALCPVCGDTICTPAAGEDASSCPADCTPATDCCSPNPTGLGCSDAGIQACVCAEDPECCVTGWDGFCVDLVESAACGVCGDD